MSNISKIDEIVSFVAKHPQSTASRRICREVLGEAVERFNEEFALDLETGLMAKDEVGINTYYSLIR